MLLQICNVITLGIIRILTCTVCEHEGFIDKTLLNRMTGVICNVITFWIIRILNCTVCELEGFIDKTLLTPMTAGICNVMTLDYSNTELYSL